MSKKFSKKYAWLKTKEYHHCYIKSTAEIIASIWYDEARGFYVVEFYGKDNDQTYFVFMAEALEYVENNCDWEID